MACLRSPIIGRLFLVVLTCSLVKGSFIIPTTISWPSSTAKISNCDGRLFRQHTRRHRTAQAHLLPDRQQPALSNRHRHNLPHWAQIRFHVAHIVGVCSAAKNDNDGEPADTAAAPTTGTPKSDTTNSKIEDPKFVQRNKNWVVIVDDEEAIRMAVGNYLFDQGYQVTACADADALLEVCAKPGKDGNLPVVPNVIISDIRMPGKDGIELLGLIRSDERLERVPVILLTAKALTQDRILGYKAGADVYLPKPFDPDELLSIVDNAIQRRRQMTGKAGGLRDLKEDMVNIKQLMRKNGANVVKKTDIFLTDTERDVLEFICKGYTNGEIAQERRVSIIGVNRMIQKIYLATKTQTRTELVRWAIETGYVAAR